MKQGRSEGAEATVLIVIISSHATARQAPGSRRAVPVDPREWDEARFESIGRSRSLDQNTACVLVGQTHFHSGSVSPLSSVPPVSPDPVTVYRVWPHTRSTASVSQKKKKFDCKYSRLQKSQAFFVNAIVTFWIWVYKVWRMSERPAPFRCADSTNYCLTRRPGHRARKCMSSGYRLRPVHAPTPAAPSTTSAHSRSPSTGSGTPAAGPCMPLPRAPTQHAAPRTDTPAKAAAAPLPPFAQPIPPHPPAQTFTTPQTTRMPAPIILSPHPHALPSMAVAPPPPHPALPPAGAAAPQQRQWSPPALHGTSAVHRVPDVA